MRAGNGELVPEVPELEREIGDGLLHQRDRVLQIVPLGARDAHCIALDAGLDLELAVLDLLDDIFRQFLLDADAERRDLLDLVATDFLDVAEFERAHVDAALGELPEQDVGHLLQLEVVVGIERELLFLVLDARVGALEIEAGGDLPVRLVERIADFDLVDFGDDVE